MNDKTTVIIREDDGTENTIVCDSAMVFAVVDMIENLKQEKGFQHTLSYAGYQISEDIFPDLFAKMITRMVTEVYGEENLLNAGVILFQLSESLQRKADEIASSFSQEEIKAYIDAGIEELLENIFDAGIDGDGE